MLKRAEGCAVLFAVWCCHRSWQGKSPRRLALLSLWLCSLHTLPPYTTVHAPNLIQYHFQPQGPSPSPHFRRSIERQPAVHTSISGFFVLLRRMRIDVLSSGDYHYVACHVIRYDVPLLFFLLFLPFVDFFHFDLDIVCFTLSFSCGYYAVSSVSAFAVTGFSLDTDVR